MMIHTPWELMRIIAATSGKIAKRAILKDNLTDEIITGAHACFDTSITYGVAKRPVVDVHAEEFDESERRASFYALLDELAARTLTGNAAKLAVHNYASSVTFDAWDLWYWPIIRRDLKIGISRDSCNEIFPADRQIFAYYCQLAKPEKDSKNHFKGLKHVEYKLDGVRALAHYDAETGVVVIRSREGAIFKNFKGVEADIKKLMEKRNISINMVLDGEIVSEKFSKLMTQVNRKYNADTSDAQFHMFDMIPEEEFNKTQDGKTPWNVPFKTRRASLEQLFEVDEDGDISPFGCLYVVWGEYVDLDTPEGQARWKAINTKALALGFEGLILKDAMCFYIPDRHFGLIKVKPVISVTLSVTGFKAADVDSSNADTFGSLECEGEDEGLYIKTAVPGFTDELRLALWNDRENVVGQLVEVEADAISQNKNGTYSLRFPRLKCFRGFVPGEKL